MIPDRRRLEALFEGAPRFLDRLEAAGPFADDDAMFTAARAIAHAMPEGEQIELVDAHPRLGAAPASVSALSYVEQGYARDVADRAGDAADRVEDAADPAEDPGATEAVAAELARLNDAYERRFGFRYCVFVAGRPRGALVPGLAAALERDRHAELDRALDAVVDIAIDRHAKLSAEATP